MVENSSEEGTGPLVPIPAVMRLRARYRGRRADYARDKIRRKAAMSIFRRPTMGDRMDNAAEKRHWLSVGSAGVELAKQETVAHERAVKMGKHEAEQGKPYRGSRTEASHRRGRN